MTLTLFVAAIVSVAALFSCANGEGMQLSVEEPGIKYSHLEGYGKGEIGFANIPSKLFNAFADFSEEACMIGMYDYLEASNEDIRTPPGDTTKLRMYRPVDMFGMWIGNIHGEMNVVFLKDGIEVQKFTSKDILGLLDDRYRKRDSKKNKPVFKGFINFFCPNESCLFNQVEIVAISDGIVTDHHTVGLLYKRFTKANIKKSTG